jgi:hypothetical protein
MLFEHVFFLLMFCGHGEGQSIPKALNDQRHALTLAG